MYKKNNLLNITLSTISIAVLLIIWEIFFKISVNYIMPSPLSVLKELFLMIETKELWKQWVSSIKRFSLGYIIGSSLGITIGILIGLHKRIDDIFYIFIHFLRHIPGLAWIPLAVLWLGIGMQSSVFVIALAAFFPVAINISAGFERVNRTYKRAALSLGVINNSFFMLKNVIIPGSITSIFSGLRIASATAWGAIVAAEMVAAASGLGFMIQYYRMLILIERVVVAMILISLTGFAIDYILRMIQNYFSRHLSE